MLFKKYMLVVVAILCAGCDTIKSATAGAGGPIGAVQTADDALLGRLGVPKSAVDQARKFLGVTDNRTLPGASRILPIGYIWRQDIIDENGKTVDITKFRRGPPYIVADGTAPNAVLTQNDVLPPLGPISTNDPIAALQQVLEAVAAHPELLDPVPTNAP